MTVRPRIPFAALITAALLAVVAALLAGQIAYRAAISDADARLEQGLLLTARAVESEIERYRYLPLVLGEDARIARVIADPGPENVDAANRYLESVATQSGAAQLFVMNGLGTAIAASNWNTPDNLTGNSYDFRPYFRDAMRQGDGRYYAIGVTTGKPGYFLASRHVSPGGQAGVVVVKVDLRPLEATWREAGVPTALMDRDGVVFLTGNPDWSYRPLYALGAAALARIGAERTYEGVDIARAVPLTGGSAPLHGVSQLDLQAADGAGLRARLRHLDADGWAVLSAEPVAEAKTTAGVWALGAALAALVLAGSVQVFLQRRQILHMRLRQREMLERRVAERTRALAHEVEARARTEAELRAAQEGLIHAEKMAALGRMSTAIVHEISQPLTAMEATLASAGLAADKAGVSGVSQRLTTARGLIRRMQRTIKHLKTFGRKDSATVEDVNIDEVIRNTLDLAQPRARALGVAPLYTPKGPPPPLRAVALRLEQVFLNLVLNALDAVAGRPDARVTLDRATVDGTLLVTLRDNGEGIDPDDLARVTEPFFSTKLSGEGLGLGLSISVAIVREYGGEIRFASDWGEGTEVTVSLPLQTSAQEAAE